MRNKKFMVEWLGQKVETKETDSVLAVSNAVFGLKDGDKIKVKVTDMETDMIDYYDVSKTCNYTHIFESM